MVAKLSRSKSNEIELGPKDKTFPSPDGGKTVFIEKTIDGKVHRIHGHVRVRTRSSIVGVRRTMVTTSKRILVVTRREETKHVEEPKPKKIKAHVWSA